jgi:TP901 family phage tail tape measure protein
VDALEYVVSIRGARAAAADVKGVAGSFNELSAAERRAGASGDVVARGAGKSGAALTALKRTAGGLSLAMIGVGFEAVKASTNFNHEMLRIRTDAGASTRELANMKTAVLELASSGASMGQSPMSLAQGLYHVESLGLRGKKALHALTLASQESAISGANLEQTTSALGAAMYIGIKGAGGLDQIMALLNATVGSGNMRMQQLIESLGTGVLGSFKIAHMSIQDVSAALAVLTDGGYQASSAAAQLSTALHFLYSPTGKAEKVLERVGLSGKKLAGDLMKPQGLLVALKDLHTHLGKLSTIDQEQAMSALLPGGRGRVLLQLYEQIGRLKGKYGQEASITGAFRGSVAAQRKDPQTQLKMQEAALQANLVRVGNQLQPVLLPALNGILSAGSSLLQFFITLPKKISHAFDAFSKSSVGKTIIGAITSLGREVHKVFGGSFLKDLATVGKALLGFFVLVMTKVIGPIQKAGLPGLVMVFKGAFNSIAGMVKILAGILTGHFGKAWAGVKQVFGGAIKGIIGGLKELSAPFNFLRGVLLKGLVVAFNTVKDVLVWLWNNVLKPVAVFLAGPFIAAWTVLKGLFVAIAAPIQAAWQLLKNVFGALGDLANWVANAGQKVLNFFASLNPFGGGTIPNVAGLGAAPSGGGPSGVSGPAGSIGAAPTHTTRQGARGVAPAGDVIPHITIKVGKHALARISRETILDAMAQGA